MANIFKVVINVRKYVLENIEVFEPYNLLSV